ncbi:hypothetical protein F5887DRAFT_1075657 [Amanita rubescens]|nr:hypothetical protein F5887DRAFT_1075657 [Amanita rubescens]
MTKRTLYIKGYKLDRQKIRNTFPREEHEPDENYELAWYRLIVEGIPETAYKYVGCGVEPDVEIGVKPPETLPQQALQLLTPGIWPSSDQDPEEEEGD